MRQSYIVSTFDRRRGGVKYVPPRKFLDGLNLRVAVPVTLFSTVLIVFCLWMLKKTPLEQKWVILRDYDDWRPFLVPEQSQDSFDDAFSFVRPIQAARTPRATRFDSPLGSENGALTYNAQPFMNFNSGFGSNHLADDLNGIGGMNTDLGDNIFAVAAGRVIYAADAGESWGNVVIIEHVVGESRPRKMLQSVYAHLGKFFVASGALVQRGDIIGEVGNANGRYPAHLHFEMRESDIADPGEGYSKYKLNRVNPSDTIARLRGAKGETLNRAPEIIDLLGPDLQGIKFDIEESVLQQK
ncbi:MAG: M23 family metallopeptidase [Verrucomicrobiales bacterium]|nr:M23 family metallopeptidase [Verrucomicrobiales bacterium]